MWKLKWLQDVDLSKKEEKLAKEAENQNAIKDGSY